MAEAHFRPVDGEFFITASVDVYKGKLQLKMKLDPLADSPTFDINAELKNTSLHELNDFLCLKVISKIE